MILEEIFNTPSDFKIPSNSKPWLRMEGLEEGLTAKPVSPRLSFTKGSTIVATAVSVGLVERVGLVAIGNLTGKS
jgi:hypothetical protein